MNLKWCAIIFAMFISFKAEAARCVPQEPHEICIKAEGTTSIERKLEKLKIQITISTHEINDVLAVNSGPSRCVGSGSHCSIVDLVTIQINGKGIAVPVSVYSDLSDLNTARIKIAHNDYRLCLTGGDASVAYIVNVHFDSGKVNRREIESAEMGEKLEETKYYFSENHSYQ